MNEKSVTQELKRRTYESNSEWLLYKNGKMSPSSLGTFFHSSVVWWITGRANRCEQDQRKIYWWCIKDY